MPLLSQNHLPSDFQMVEIQAGRYLRQSQALNLLVGASGRRRLSKTTLRQGRPSNVQVRH